MVINSDILVFCFLRKLDFFFLGNITKISGNMTQVLGDVTSGKMTLRRFDQLPCFLAQS